MVLTTLITLLAPKKSTGGKYSLWEETVPPFAGPPPHSHSDEELFYVVSGNFEFILNDPTRPITANAGDSIHIPADALHTYKNVGETVGKLITMVTPGKLEDYFRAVGKPVNTATDIPDLNAVPDFSKLDAGNFIALAPQYDVTFHL